MKLDTYNCSDICSNLEIDYDKREIRAKTRYPGGELDIFRGFGMITHYEFEYVKTKEDENTTEDIDSRDYYETMRVNGPCEELDDFTQEEESFAISHHYEVGLKLWYFYYANSTIKTSSLFFLDKNALEARRLLKPLIKYLRSRFLEDSNIFVGSEHLRIANIVSLGIPRQEFVSIVSSWHLREGSNYVRLPKFGECSIAIDNSEIIGYAKLETRRRFNEDEMHSLFDYMKETMPLEDYYDDGGYGVPPEPGVIRHFWPLPQGTVHMHWNPYNNSPGLDYVKIELYDHTAIEEIQDEEYRRSEVD